MNVVSFCLGAAWMSAFLIIGFTARQDTPKPFQADYAIAVEKGYGSKNDGIQFVSFQRIQSRDIDRAVLSVDADLPLFKALEGKKRVRITIEDVPAPELKTLIR